MDINSLGLKANNLLVEVFNKEGLAVFVIFCLMIFALASIAAYWAIKSGEFRDMEAAKYEMLEDNL